MRDSPLRRKVFRQNSSLCSIFLRVAGSSDRGESRDKESRHRRAALLQPLRRRIARRLCDGEEASAGELATELGETLGGVAYHLCVLRRQGVLRAVPRRGPAPPRYRWHPDAVWADELLAEEDEKGA